ncbi:MAG: ATP-binding protein [Tissierellia bacterium]|nr:ATP-binding protein [Tissierellia bacterium]
MFSSIKWRFIVIYVLLVIVVMAIVGGFIVNRLEDDQLEKLQDDMSQTLSAVAGAAPYLTEQNWEQTAGRMQNTLNEWRLSTDESIYVIEAGEVPRIIASSVRSGIQANGANALSYPGLSASGILRALEGEIQREIIEEPNGQMAYAHYIQPVYNRNGDVAGLMYMTTSLAFVQSVVGDARVILSYATLVALTITGALGYILAQSITGPIRAVTQKAQEMSEGNFDQKVEVKSNDEIGQLGSMFNVLTTELKDTLNRIDTERSKLDTIFNYMAEGVIALNRRGQPIHVNPVGREILELEGELEEIEYWDVRQLNIQGINYYDESSLSGTAQAQIKDKFYNIRYAPYKTEFGQDVGLIVVLQDITDEHNLDILRKDFVANVGHELKTPLTTIKSYTETLLNASLEERAAKRFLEIINREADRMNHLVVDLLQLSNMDARRQVWDLKSMDVYETVTLVLESLQPMIGEKHHHVHLEIPTDIHNFIGDPHGVSQVLTNILSNAVKYTSYGGRITVSAKNYGSRVHIKISDNGMGMGKRDLERIFERFYRVNKDRSRTSGGTGLGLSIAKEIMESMDGRIRIKSELSVGTTVLLSFPVDEALL